MRYPVLASLAAAPAHGYEIKRGLEERFGSAVAPLNIGQVYTSLQRLQRDHLVEDEEAREGGRDRRVYRLTDAGRDDDTTTALVIEGAALHLEADLKWLDRCEEVLGRENG